MKAVWGLLALLVAVQIGYPLSGGATRAGLVVVTVLIGFAVSVTHAALTRGWRAGAAVVAVAVAGFGVELLGVHTGLPFGGYAYAGPLGPRLAGVPVVIGLAWAWMAWPGWLAAGRLCLPVAGRVAPPGLPTRVAQRWLPGRRIFLAGIALAAWDLFLDPQMVADGYWRWSDPRPALPGVPGVPVGNYLGWLLVAVLVAVGFAVVLTGRRAAPQPADTPMYALYLWTYLSSVLAHAAFLSLPASAGWGALGMGLIALPLAVRLVRALRRPDRDRPSPVPTPVEAP